MDIGYLLFSYIIWHYTKALVDLFKIWGNIFIFLCNFFSFGIILKTFLSPWHRLGENYSGKVDPFELFSSFIVNTLMRLVGIIFRTIIIVISLIVIFSTFVLALLTLLIWLIWPILIILFFIFGLLIIIKVF
ncbi:MAG TPA: hypothetical protein ENN31_00980 [Candidatus Vogelbacteria bacterium]|nr:hypothetical protein [Candidatus Vogelbacteria bacterium]